MEIEIRKAFINDLNEIQRLNGELFKKEFNEYDDSLNIKWPFLHEGKSYFKEMIEQNYVVVALIHNNIIGYLIGSINIQSSLNTTKIAELNNMLIDENYRGSGIGKKLINSFINYCDEQNMDEIRVTASFKNIDAIKFYKKNGFEEFELTLRKKNIE